LLYFSHHISLQETLKKKLQTMSDGEKNSITGKDFQKRVLLDDLHLGYFLIYFLCFFFKFVHKTIMYL
jgi:hypothetical protein